MTDEKLKVYFFGFLVLAVVILTYFIFLPFMVVLVLSATAAVIAQPLYKKLQNLCKGQEIIPAFCTIIILAIVILLPLGYLSLRLITEAQDLYLKVSFSQVEGTGPGLIDIIESKIHHVLPSVSLDLHKYVAQFSSWLLVHLADIFSGTLDIIIKVFLGMIALFYFLKDGDRFKKTVFILSPLPDTHDEAIFSTLAKTMRSVVFGSIIVALVQGFLSGVGFVIFGIPNPTLWGTVAGVCAFIPGIGTSLVLVPAIFYLFFFGHGLSWVGLLVWAVVAVSLIDNFLSPKLIERGVHIHPLFILFSVIGGVSFFGPEGFILGPLVLSLLVALIKIYGELTTHREINL